VQQGVRLLEAGVSPAGSPCVESGCGIFPSPNRGLDKIPQPDSTQGEPAGENQPYLPFPGSGTSDSEAVSGRTLTGRSMSPPAGYLEIRGTAEEGELPLFFALLAHP
jgi:hypothetical protein